MVNSIKSKNAISLIVLVITILVITILASAVIISLSNTDVIDETTKTVFKSDMSKYKEIYEMYVTNQLANDSTFDRTKLTLTYEDAEFSKIFGNISDKHKEGLKVIDGMLIYQSTDETEQEIVESMGMNLEFISKTDSYVGYFADIDGDGVVDGVIFVDLCKGGSGKWNKPSGTPIITYTISPIEDKSTVKDYYISQASYMVKGANGYGTYPVLKSIGKGEDRFYVMALEDVNSGTNYYWYNSASGNNTLYEVTSNTFGYGKQNTHVMIEKWNSKVFGEQNAQDIWGVIQDQVYGGKEEKTLENVKWFVPNAEEYTAFVVSIGADLTTSEYSTEYGLNGRYWTSQYACIADFYYRYIRNLKTNESASLRLAATF